jgi:uncharacterized Zn ribbon protein
MKATSRLPIKALAALHGLTQYTTKAGKKFWYKDNGSKVLFVAHQDTVQKPGVFQPVRFSDDTWVFSSTHDDRLGMYIGLDYLKKAKVKVDILITDDEEDGRSTALWFDAPKKYNWMFMFDRKGTGAVCYQYENEALSYKLGRHNFMVNRGTYSCIRDLEHLGCVGINFGTGYHNNHEEKGYASMKELRHQMRKFIDFYKEYRYVSMPHDIGYRRFAEAVSYQSWEYKKEEQEIYAIKPNMLPIKTPPVPMEKLFQIADAIYEDIDDKPGGHGSEDEIWKHTAADTEQPFAYRDYGETKVGTIKGQLKYMLGENKSDKELSHASVSPEGKLKSGRWAYQLYQPFEMVHPDKSIQNILRNTYGIKLVYDICLLSPFKLATDGFIEPWEVDYMVRQVNSLGLSMPMNLQGLKNSNQWLESYTNGYKKRGRSLRSCKANDQKYVRTNSRLGQIGEIAPDVVKHDIVPWPKVLPKIRVTIGKDKKTYYYNETAKRRAKKVEVADYLADKQEKLKEPFSSGNQSLIMFPKPGQEEKAAKSLKYLKAKGYNVELKYVCASCKEEFEYEDRSPVVCPVCRASLERDVESLSKDQIAITDVLVPELVSGDEIFSKIKAIKEKDDDSNYEYIGNKTKSKESIDKYAWVSANKKPYKRDDGIKIYA